MSFYKKLLALAFVLACVPSFASDSDTEGTNKSVKKLTKQVKKLTIRKKSKIQKKPTHLTLRRTDMKYAEKLAFGDEIDQKYNLNCSRDRKLSTKAFNLSAKDSNCNHLFAGATTVYLDKDKEVVIHHKPLTTSVFSKSGIKQSGTNLKIDWMSSSSGFKDGHDVKKDVFFRRSGTGNKHSEPQFVADFNALLVKDSDTVVKCFMPQSLKDAGSVLMCGPELYSSFDMCTTCHGVLNSDFFEDAFKALKAKLKDKRCKCSDMTRVLIYHAERPYIYAPYRVRHKKTDYKLTANTSLKFDTESHASDALDYTVLSQRRSIEVVGGGMYGFIHSLSGQVVEFDNGSYQF